MNKKKYTFIILVAIVIIGGSLAFKNITSKVSNKGVANTQLDLGIPIELSSVGKSDIVEDISYIGTIVPKKSSVVSPTIGGQIVDIYVEEGSVVRSGDLLAKIDDTQLNASLNTALRKLETLRTNYNYLSDQVENFYITNPLIKKLETLTSSYEYIKGESDKYAKLYDEGAVSKATYDKIKQETDTVYLQLEELKATTDDAYNKLLHEKNMTEKQLEEVNASLDEIKIKIEDTLIKAPIQGVIKKLYYDEGDLAVTGKPFVDIDDNDELLVKVNVTENDMNRINIGNKVVLKLSKLDGEIVTEVTKIMPNVNPNTRVGEIEISLTGIDEEINLVSGNSVNVSIVTNEAKDVIVIPQKAIKDLGDRKIVYIYEDGIAREIDITTGLNVNGMVEVIEGLEEGDKIVTKNLSKLYDGIKVYVFEGVD